jgi:hypothetical protein
MNNIVIVGSSIQPREGKFTYSQTRSLFDTEERFRQTFFTINSIRNSLPNAKIVIVDSSNDYRNYFVQLSILKNVDYIPLKELSYSAFEEVNTHYNKSYCESLLLNTYYRTAKKDLLNYDYIIKATGRYFYFDFNDSLFNESNLDKMFFKKPLRFVWNDAWNYWMVDRRTAQQNNLLHQYCTVLYGFGAQHLEKMIDINEAAMNFMGSVEMKHYDIETLSYYLTRPYEDRIIETDWRVSGWDGVSGKFMFY